ncbi:MAG: hypothetical protein ACR2MD_12700 [Aridibacter sp.]
MKRSIRNLFSVFSILFISLFFVIQASAQGEDVKGDAGTRITKIGILLPEVKLMEATGDISPEEALRNTYAVLLKSDTFEFVAIDSRLTSLALEEAVKKECDYLLDVSLIQEQKKSGGGLFGKIARDTARRATWETANSVPYGGSTGGRIARTAARSSIINTGYTISNMNIKIKKKDKLTLDYKLSTAKGEKLLDKKIEEKAGSDTDDLLMKMLEKSGEDLVAFLRKDMGSSTVMQ